MRPALFALPFALFLAAPALADVKADQPGDDAPVARNADGSFTITETIEADTEALDALPWEADQIDGRGDASRRPRDEADEALEEAFEEAEDIARTEAGPD
ncbi:MAG TPA: hypothetical protein VIT45_14150 [Allosphingosinicella sp.]